MAVSLEELRTRRRDIIRMLDGRGAANPRIFGSVARGTADERSDVDVLVEIREPRPRGFRYVGLIADLEEELGALLGRPVHVVEIRRPKTRIGQKILREAVPL